MRLLSLFAVGLFASALVAAPVPKDKEKTKDEDAIQSTWKADKFENAGAPGGPPPGELEKIRFVFEKDGKLRVTGGPSGDEMTGTYKLDPAAKLKAIDMVVKDPSGREHTALGVYELDGDTLKLCFSDGDNKPRPEELKPDGKGVAVVTFTRVKDEKKDDKKDK